MAVEEHHIQLAEAAVFYRRAGGDGVPALYLHSAPTSSDDWTALLELTGGMAPDLPGFGRSDKGGQLDYSLPAYADFVERFADALELPELTLVAHGWGAAIGLVFAQRHPDRVARLAIVDAVPLLEGFRWPPLIRWLRRPGIGEVVIGSITRRMLARGLRRGATSPEAWPDERVRAVWDQLDQGTQRAILRLHRSADEGELAVAGSELGHLRRPTLVMWGERDPWLAPRFAQEYARRLPAAEVAMVPAAGHWPWLDRPEAVNRLAAFVSPAQPA